MKNQLLVFFLEEQKYALRLSEVERVVRAVEVVRLPGAPEIIMGVIDVRSRIVPVVNIRRRFGLPEREIQPQDQIVIARASKRSVALVVDSTVGVVEHPDEAISSSKDILPDTGYIAGVIRLEDGLILIHDLETFLSLEENEKLGAALDCLSGAGAARREEVDGS